MEAPKSSVLKFIVFADLSVVQSSIVYQACFRIQVRIKEDFNRELYQSLPVW